MTNDQSLLGLDSKFRKAVCGLTSFIFILGQVVVSPGALYAAEPVQTLNGNVPVVSLGEAEEEEIEEEEEIDTNLPASPLSSPDKNSDLDGVPPAGSIILNGGAVYTNSRMVTMAIHASDDAVEFRYVVDNGDKMSMSAWQTLPEDGKTTVAFHGDGVHKVSIQLRDNEGLTSQIITDSIILDTVAPLASVDLVQLEDQNLPGQIIVQLNIRASEDAVQMRFYKDDNGFENGDGAWSGITSTALTRFATEGLHSVKLQVRDAAGNVSMLVTDSIELKFPDNSGQLEEIKAKGKDVFEHINDMLESYMEKMSGLEVRIGDLYTLEDAFGPAEEISLLMKSIRQLTEGVEDQEIADIATYAERVLQTVKKHFYETFSRDPETNANEFWDRALSNGARDVWLGIVSGELTPLAGVLDGYRKEAVHYFDALIGSETIEQAKRALEKLMSLDGSLAPVNGSSRLDAILASHAEIISEEEDLRSNAARVMSGGVVRLEATKRKIEKIISEKLPVLEFTGGRVIIEATGNADDAQVPYVARVQAMDANGQYRTVDSYSVAGFEPIKYYGADNDIQKLFIKTADGREGEFTTHTWNNKRQFFYQIFDHVQSTVYEGGLVVVTSYDVFDAKRRKTAEIIFREPAPGESLGMTLQSKTWVFWDDGSFRHSTVFISLENGDKYSELTITDEPGGEKRTEVYVDLPDGPRFMYDFKSDHVSDLNYAMDRAGVITEVKMKDNGGDLNNDGIRDASRLVGVMISPDKISFETGEWVPNQKILASLEFNGGRVVLVNMADSQSEKILAQVQVKTTSGYKTVESFSVKEYDTETINYGNNIRIEKLIILSAIGERVTFSHAVYYGRDNFSYAIEDKVDSYLYQSELMRTRTKSLVGGNAVVVGELLRMQMPYINGVSSIKALQYSSTSYDQDGKVTRTSVTRYALDGSSVSLVTTRKNGQESTTVTAFDAETKERKSWVVADGHEIQAEDITKLMTGISFRSTVDNSRILQDVKISISADTVETTITTALIQLSFGRMFVELVDENSADSVNSLKYHVVVQALDDDGEYRSIDTFQAVEWEQRKFLVANNPNFKHHEITIKTAEGLEAAFLLEDLRPTGPEKFKYVIKDEVYSQQYEQRFTRLREFRIFNGEKTLYSHTIREYYSDEEAQEEKYRTIQHRWWDPEYSTYNNARSTRKNDHFIFGDVVDGDNKEIITAILIRQKPETSLEKFDDIYDVNVVYEEGSNLISEVHFSARVELTTGEYAIKNVHIYFNGDEMEVKDSMVL